MNMEVSTSMTTDGKIIKEGWLWKKGNYQTDIAILYLVIGFHHLIYMKLCSYKLNSYFLSSHVILR